MVTTDWDSYGTGNYEKCSDCMAHCGYEATAVEDAFKNPLKALWVSMRGPKVTGDMAPEIDLSNQRPAEFVFEKVVETAQAEQEVKADSKKSAKKPDAAAV